MGLSIYYSLIIGLCLVIEVCTKCPRSTVCKCEPLSEDSQFNVSCNGNGVRQTLNQENLPDNIRTLIVEKFIFQNLSVDTFPRNIRVQRFHLKHNEIWDIKNDTFYQFESLSEVFFCDSTLTDNNQLIEAFAGIRSRGNLTLVIQGMHFTQLDFSNIVFQGKVMLTTLRLTRNAMGIFRPELVNNMDYLETLSLADNIISHFSKNRTQLTPLLLLDMSNNRLNPIEIEFCYNNGSSLFPNLRTLNVSRNFISTIQKESWSCLDKLEILDLSDNNIQTIFINNLTHLASLKHLILKKNWIKSFEVNEGMYPPHLEYLDLSDNQFVPFMPQLCENSSNGTISIQRLDLSFNHIIVLTDNFTRCLRNLTELYLSKNAIQKIQNDSFAQFPQLKVLHIDGQIHGLTTIEKNAFKMNNLKELNLNRNFIHFNNESSDRILSGCIGIRYLSLSHNHVLNKTAFFSSLAHLKHIEVLVLEQVRLIKFPYELFTSFETLQYAVIDHNGIESIYFPPSITFNSRITHLSAADNRISFSKNNNALPEPVLTYLKEVNFGYNIFDCSCDVSSRWFRSQISENGSQGFFQQHIRLIGWPHTYLCHTPSEMIGKEVMHFHLSALDCVNIVVYISSASTGFVVCVIGIVSYWNRWYIQFYWHRCKKSCKRIRKFADAERQQLIENIGVQYDAFVIYNDDDSKFVFKDLRMLVEEKLQYKLFIWDRQGGVGGSKFNAFFDAINASKNVIVVVSNNLIKDAWCEFQVDIALMSRMETRGKRKIFLVILTDVDLESVSKSWCVLLAKKGNGKWIETENSIRRRVFIEDMKATLGKPLSVEGN
ncbi:toll-like receptor 13 [Mya arenaria]|uniref:toll-like receptor 13 n=1 Tax=Mya arenaria TaxID=6604 RepID=UPI0022E36298|nr:toll-like receptor 13 [Mya arenaria]